MAGRSFICRLKLADPVCRAESVTVTAKVLVLSPTVGVPLITPVLDEITSPLGKFGLTVYASGITPPVAATGLTAAAGASLVIITSDWLVDTANGIGFILN